MKMIATIIRFAVLFSISAVTRSATWNIQKPNVDIGIHMARQPHHHQRQHYYHRKEQQQHQPQHEHQQQHSICSALSLCRGGSTAVMQESDNENDEDEPRGPGPEEEKKRLALKKWRMDQQNLLQLRSFVLSEILAKRGIPLATLVGVSTAEGDKPPERVDWDCAMSTEEDSKPCLYSFDAEPNTKVVAPMGTTQWITLSALNRLRRTDPTKVEPMWHSQYAVLQSWFGENSEFSMLQHVGFKGFLVTLLLDSARGTLLKALLVLTMITTTILFMPILEFALNRFLVSCQFWKQWPTWSRIVHAALPLKLLIGQMAWKFMANSFGKVEAKVRDYIVDVECDMLEQSIPLTVGPESQDPMEKDAWDEEEIVPITAQDDSSNDDNDDGCNDGYDSESDW